MVNAQDAFLIGVLHILRNFIMYSGWAWIKGDHKVFTKGFGSCRQPVLLFLVDKVANSHGISFKTKTGQQANTFGSDQALVPKLFAAVDI